ncbi:hypothetical protein K7432_005493 [Basidiobolus ranarum]|uniref:Uncharacterized protein n=1 Tax=Basidiobolus ranarum TaxID=34480 RepID=A0ABR2WWE6_9FUNG
MSTATRTMGLESTSPSIIIGAAKNSSHKPNMSISFSKDVNWLKESCKLPRSPYPKSTLFGSIATTTGTSENNN